MMAVYCNGKKALCFDYEKCSKECEFFDGSGWYEVETNGDRIRVMTDEELIKAFGHYTICGYIQEKRSEWCETNGACSNCLLRWLKQPVEVDNDRA